MSEIADGDAGSKLLNLPKGVLLSIAVLVIGSVAAFWLLLNFVDGERQRDLREWQVRLGIVADSRHAAVEQWIDEQYDSLVSLAYNSSLQFYAMDLLETPEQNVEGAAAKEIIAEAQYLSNLLNVIAEREGFINPTNGPEIRANVSRLGETGIALINQKGEIIVATKGMPAISGDLAEAIKKLVPAKRGLVDIQLGISGKPAMGFAVPVFSVQGNKVASDQIGILFGLRYVAEDLYPLLKQPGVVEKTAEGVLLRQNGALIEYLSPLSGDTKLLKLALTNDDDSLAAGFAVKNPGGFSIKRDYRNQDVLAVSRKISGAPWTLMYKVNRAEALAESDERLQSMMMVGIVVVFLLLAVIIASWRYGASVRTEKALLQYRETSALFENILNFMRVIADSQSTEIFAVTEDGIYTFANRKAAEVANTSPQDMKGKSMSSVVGPIKAKTFADVNQDVLDGFKQINKIYTFDGSAGSEIFKVSHIPLRADANYPPSVLVVADDITSLMHDQEIRKTGMRQLTRALVVLLDHKDPYSTVHSAIVAKIAHGVALQLGLPEDDLDTIDLAGNLINLGKVVVPTDVLLKEGALSSEEKAFLKDSMLVASKLVHSVEFGLPVLETLSQVREYWDGSGPRGLKGDQILLTSRLIAGASALVGLMSARKHRAGLSYEDAVQVLQKETGARLGPQVLSALTNFVENQGGREIIKLIDIADGSHMDASQLIHAIDQLGE